MCRPRARRHTTCTDYADFLDKRATLNEIELTFASPASLPNLSQIRNVIEALDAGDTRLEAALLEPWGGRLDNEGYATVKEYIVAEPLRIVTNRLRDRTHEGYSFKRFVRPNNDTLYRFWGDHGVGDDERGELLEALSVLLAIPGVYEASGATSITIRLR